MPRNTIKRAKRNIIEKKKKSENQRVGFQIFCFEVSLVRLNASAGDDSTPADQSAPAIACSSHSNGDKSPQIKLLPYRG
jgi:hypothetical protein